ncbi:hypothetical protein GCM10010082_22300 [Kushneria pakistanensis]|uniref:Uncharacterized protein n=1 Tax=Kushneria pakistanensis TaxID=1508770 RepID=A0ABQ3FKX3_9GAMM|nr:hypothetical protein GCM10010082_22300 [Kushneria pakistanensis]
MNGREFLHGISLGQGAAPEEVAAPHEELKNKGRYCSQTTTCPSPAARAVIPPAE